MNNQPSSSVRPGIESLLAVLRGEPDRLADLTNEEWMRVLAIADAERILPLTAEKIRRSGIKVSIKLDEELRQVEQAALRECFFWNSVLRELLSGLERACVPVLLLKGPMLGERLYGRAELRVNRDLDILVRPEDEERAAEGLRRLGYRSEPDSGFQHSTWRRNGMKVELHTEVENPSTFNFGTWTAWDRAEEVEFLGSKVRRFCPEDELAYLCFHSCRERYAVLKNAVDVESAFRLFGPAQGADDARKRVMELGARVSELLRLGTSAPEAPQSILAALLWSYLIQLEPGARPKPYDEWIFHEVGVPGWQRFPRVRRFIKRVTENHELHAAFAAQLGIHREWQVWLLRPVRRAWNLWRRLRKRARGGAVAATLLCACLLNAR